MFRLMKVGGEVNAEVELDYSLQTMLNWTSKFGYKSINRTNRERLRQGTHLRLRKTQPVLVRQYIQNRMAN